MPTATSNLKTMQHIHTEQSIAPIKERLKEYHRLGWLGAEAASHLEELRAVADNRDNDIILRGYASWAADTMQNAITPHIAQTYHVSSNHPGSSDTCSGSEQSPFETIQKAAEVASAGDTVIVHEGVYREFIRPFHSGTESAPIIYQAADGEEVVIKACDFWEPQWRDEGDGCWSAPYERLSWDVLKPEIPAARCEQVFVDGALLTHVATKNEVFESAATMWTDEQERRLYIHLGSGTPETCTIERSVRPQCFMPAVRGLGYITVRGFHMIGGSAPRWHGPNWHDIDHLSVLSVNTGHHWIIENNNIEWGNAQGLEVAGGGFAKSSRVQPIVHVEPGTDTEAERRQVHTYRKSLCANVIRGNKINYHGVAGIVGISNARDILIEDNEVCGNCVKDNSRIAEAAGIKIHGMKHNLIRRNIVRDNHCHGIWIETDSEYTRATSNILINNDNYNFFCENCPGPNLLDNNVIIDTREDTHAAGFYTHTGDGALFINNIILGTFDGVRVRGLFHFKHRGKLTTTSNNCFYNNIIADCKSKLTRLMPEVARCEGNRADYNVYWNSGKPVMLYSENTGEVGINWESTSLGKALGLTGGGPLDLPLDIWAKHLDGNKDSVCIPTQLLLKEKSAPELRTMMQKAWKKLGNDFDGWYFDAKPNNLDKWLGLLCRRLEGARLIRSIQLSPSCGIQLWKAADGAKMLEWDKSSAGSLKPLKHAVMEAKPHIIDETIIAVGETGRIALDGNYSVALTALDSQVHNGQLQITTSCADEAGQYSVALVSENAWAIAPVRLSAPCAIENVFEKYTDNGPCVCVEISNNSSSESSARIETTLGDENLSCEVALAPKSRRVYDLPVACRSATECTVSVKVGSTVLTETKLLSFAAAQKADSWENAQWHDMDNFPGGLFPEGAFDYEFYKGNLHAKWASRYDEQGIHMRVQVEHTYHIAERADIEGFHGQDAIKIALKGKPGFRNTMVAMTLLSTTGKPSWGFHRSSNEEKYPIGEYPDLPASIVREGKTTIYDVLYTWDMLSLDKAPPKHTYLPLSIAVFCKDPGASTYGLQWFFGILYNSREGKEEFMGKLWMV